MSETKSKYCGCLYYSANALARVMTKMAEEAFAPLGMAPSYAFLLMSVNGKPGIQPKELSGQMQLTPSTVTRLIEKMEAKGYLERRSQGRATAVHPTAKSLALEPSIKQSWRSLHDRYVSLLGTEAALSLTREVYAASQILGD